MICESSCLKEPAAALRGFANNDFPLFSLSLLSSSKSFLNIITSPRTSITSGISLPKSFRGTFLIVFTFRVTSSPLSPFPLVDPCTSIPFSYLIDTASPSIFSSVTYSTVFVFASLFTRLSNSIRSVSLKAFPRESIGLLWYTVLNSFSGEAPTLREGESGVTRLGNFCSSARSSWNNLSYS